MIPYKRKELIAGGVIVALGACGFLNMLVSLIKTQQSLPVSFVSADVAVIIGWLATLFAFGTVAFAAWIVAQARPEFEEWAQRRAIRITIPAYFWFALSPLGIGAFLIAGVGLTTWGWWLAALSLPATLLLLILLLRKRNSA